MKCEDFIIARETGGPLRRFLARRHAAKCPQCAAKAARLDAAMAELQAAESLTPRQRHLWTSAAQSAQTRPSRLRVAVIASVATCAIAVAVVVLRRPPALHPDPTPGPIVTVIDPKLELDRLAADAKRLDADIERLLQQADRIDAQRQVATTLDRFARW